MGDEVEFFYCIIRFNQNSDGVLSGVVNYGYDLNRFNNVINCCLIIAENVHIANMYAKYLAELVTTTTLTEVSVIKGVIYHLAPPLEGQVVVSPLFTDTSSLTKWIDKNKKLKQEFRAIEEEKRILRNQKRKEARLKAEGKAKEAASISESRIALEAIPISEVLAIPASIRHTDNSNRKLRFGAIIRHWDQYGKAHVGLVFRVRPRLDLLFLTTNPYWSKLSVKLPNDLNIAVQSLAYRAVRGKKTSWLGLREDAAPEDVEILVDANDVPSLLLDFVKSKFENKEVKLS